VIRTRGAYFLARDRLPFTAVSAPRASRANGRADHVGLWSHFCSAARRVRSPPGVRPEHRAPAWWSADAHRRRVQAPERRRLVRPERAASVYETRPECAASPAEHRRKRLNASDERPVARTTRVPVSGTPNSNTSTASSTSRSVMRSGASLSPTDSARCVCGWRTLEPSRPQAL
jgi:hypothetical protein